MNETDILSLGDAEDSESFSGESFGNDFIRGIIGNDLASGRHKKIITRFPPEPNG